MEMAQLMRGVPRLEGPERVHLAEGAEQREECSEDGEPCRQSTVGELVDFSGPGCGLHGLDISFRDRGNILAGDGAITRNPVQGREEGHGSRKWRWGRRRRVEKGLHCGLLMADARCSCIY